MSAIEKFMRCVDSSAGVDACHPWTGSTRKGGYGQFYVDGSYQTAPRWLLGHLRGRPLTRAEEACHRCDNPLCCNERHLYIGDHASNMRDAMARGRHPAAAIAARANCSRGHPWDEQNAYVRPDRSSRGCRACNRAAVARYKRRQRSRP